MKQNEQRVERRTRKVSEFQTGFEPTCWMPCFKIGISTTTIHEISWYGKVFEIEVKRTGTCAVVNY